MSDLGAPLPTSPMVDLKSGRLTREWYLFLIGVFNRTGGSQGINADDSLSYVDVTSPELQMALDSLTQAVSVTPTVQPQVLQDSIDMGIQALQAQVADLQRQINDLQLGIL